jgi:glucokinase
MNNMTAVGIDIGGTHVKSGIVDSTGEITDYNVCSTLEWIESGDFVGKLIELIARFRQKGIDSFGVGVPGLISKDGQRFIEVTAIPELNNLAVPEMVRAKFPGSAIFFENDANAAAMGEYYFSEGNSNQSFALVTIGTGIGSGLILDGKIFKGGNGNALELGELVSRNGAKLEHLIGSEGLIKRYSSKLAIKPNEVSVFDIVSAANKGDQLSMETLIESGEILGEALVALIVLFDITNIALGGGISEGFNYIEEGINNSFRKSLIPYYLNKIQLTKAVHGNMAGLLGMASIRFKNRESA